MVTIESKNHSINLGGGGFICLRTKVAELAAPDIFEHYKKSMDGMRLYDDDKRKAFYKSYNAKITELDKKYKGKMSNILDFLYESDCDGIMDMFLIQLVKAQTHFRFKKRIFSEQLLAAPFFACKNPAY